MLEYSVVKLFGEKSSGPKSAQCHKGLLYLITTWLSIRMRLHRYHSNYGTYELSSLLKKLWCKVITELRPFLMVNQWPSYSFVLHLIYFVNITFLVELAVVRVKLGNPVMLRCHCWEQH